MMLQLNPNFIGQAQVCSEDSVYPGIIQDQVLLHHLELLHRGGGLLLSLAFMDHEQCVLGGFAIFCANEGEHSGRGDLASIVKSDGYWENMEKVVKEYPISDETTP